MEHKHSRGELPTNFLTSDLSPVDYCKVIALCHAYFYLVCITYFYCRAHKPDISPAFSTDPRAVQCGRA